MSQNFFSQLNDLFGGLSIGSLATGTVVGIGGPLDRILRMPQDPIIWNLAGQQQQGGNSPVDPGEFGAGVSVEPDGKGKPNRHWWEWYPQDGPVWWNPWTWKWGDNGMHPYGDPGFHGEPAPTGEEDGSAGTSPEVAEYLKLGAGIVLYGVLLVGIANFIKPGLAGDVAKGAGKAVAVA